MKGKNPTNKLDQQNRDFEQMQAKSFFKTRQKFGTIKKTHEKLYAAVIELAEGGEAWGGGFLPIVNPWQELIKDFGPLRRGLRVVVEYEGDQEAYATARVIGLENEPIGQFQERADKDLGLYEIFVPGI
jgi:hypothetical protein